MFFQLLSKGRRVYVDGRIQYREITDSAGVRKQISEIVIEDMILLDNKSMGGNVNAKEEEVAGVSEEMDLASGAIEDIVIPDDIGLNEETPVAGEEKTVADEQA